MTSEQSRPGACASANQTILFNGFRSVFGASRREPAGCWQPWRDNKLIDSHRPQCESLNDDQTHLSAPRRATNSARNSSNFRSVADPRGFTTKSNPIGIAVRDVRKISLILLLTRLRTCALPSFRGVVNPKRL